MKTVDRAMQLLKSFSKEQHELGLTAIAKLNGFDKATTRRLLQSLMKHSLIEQNPVNRDYRLGPGLLSLAQLREDSRPMRSIAKTILASLAESTGETAHFGLLAGEQIANIAVHESEHANRVTMSAGEHFPLHATSSGLVILAFSADEFIERMLDKPKTIFTKNTPIQRKQLDKLLKTARSDGYIINTGFYEADVCSIAAPVFDQSKHAVGAISVATPSTRFTASSIKSITKQVLAAAANMTDAIGGQANAYKDVS